MSEKYQFKSGEEYLAKPLGMMYFESKEKGTPGFKVAFNLETEAGLQRLDWSGWLSEKSKTRTIETVTNLLGWDGALETDGNGIFPQTALNLESQVKVTVKYNDKGYPEIEWVNSLGGAKFAGAATVQAKKGMEMLGLKAEFLAVKKKSGSSAPAASSTVKKDLPF